MNLYSPSLTRASAVGLLGGGALTAVLNGVLTPLLPAGSFVAVAGSGAFLWRRAFSAIAAAFLLLGCVGLYVAQSARAGRFGLPVFACALLGNALLLAWEWVNIFVLRELALRSPGALQLLEDAKGMTPYHLGAIIPVTLFTIGWIGLAASTIRSSPSRRFGAAVIITGFFAVPILSAAFGGRTGGALENAVLGTGWCLVGWSLWKDPATGATESRASTIS